MAGPNTEPCGTPVVYCLYQRLYTEGKPNVLICSFKLQRVSLWNQEFTLCFLQSNGPNTEPCGAPQAKEVYTLCRGNYPNAEPCDTPYYFFYLLLRRQER